MSIPGSELTGAYAIEDARCAVRWALQNAKEYSIDVNRIIVTGQSAGSQLALMAGLAPASVTELVDRDGNVVASSTTGTPRMKPFLTCSSLPHPLHRKPIQPTPAAKLNLHNCR